ncbi:MAG: LemA family protein [Candidatus Omnitrophica bacterium]|nr:LemA family protein [Candidatus Omnitrophota bacterium]
MIVLIAIVFFAVFSVMSQYNRQVALRSRLEEALSGVDVQLKRRHDLIPNLVSIVKGYARYEKDLLEEVTLARSKAVQWDNTIERARAEGQLALGLRSLLAVAERYPDLKANQSFLGLQTSLVKVEDELQMARRYYNGTVRDYNVCIKSFPGNVVAGMYGFKPAQFFEIEYATDRAVVDVSFSQSLKGEGA